METTHASITVDTAMTRSPRNQRSPPPDAIDELTHDEHEPEHPDDVDADDGEDVGLRVVVPDDHVAAEIHHAGHHRQARNRSYDCGRNAGPSQDLAERRCGSVVGAAPGARPARSSSSAIVRGSGRIASARMSPTTHIAAAASHGTTSVSSSMSFPANSGRNTSGPSAAPNSAPKRTYEMARALRDSGYMSATAVRARSTAPFIPPITEEAEDDERRRVSDTSECGQHAAHRADDEPSGDHGNTPVPVHETAGGQRGKRAGGQEDRRPQAEDRLDPGDENERDRGDGGSELKHTGKRHETQRQQHGVSPDLPRARHAASVSVATMAET